MKITDVQKNRIELSHLFKGSGVELGVERGVFSEQICKENPEVTLIGIDPLKAYKSYREHVSQDKLDGFYNEVIERMKGYNYTFIRKFSADALLDIADESLDFVYIDANHNYENAYFDIKEWAKKVKKGGIVSGHDYIRRKGQADLFAVVDAVNDYAKTYGIEEVFIYRGDKSPSWMFIK